MYIGGNFSKALLMFMKENGRQKKKLVKTQKSKIYIHANHFLKLCFVFSRKRKATFANETNGKINK